MPQSRDLSLVRQRDYCTVCARQKLLTKHSPLSSAAADYFFPFVTTHAHAQASRASTKTASRVPCRQKGEVIQGNVELNDEDDEDGHPRGGDGKRLLTARQAVLASAIGSSHMPLGESQTSYRIAGECSNHRDRKSKVKTRKKRQSN